MSPHIGCLALKCVRGMGCNMVSKGFVGGHEIARTQISGLSDIFVYILIYSSALFHVECHTKTLRTHTRVVCKKK